MGAIAEILKLGFKNYLSKHSGKIPLAHIKAAEAIIHCRSGKKGGHLYRCSGENCLEELFQPHSCNHRCCPVCQSKKRYEWTLKQKKLLLPVPYFHLVFTVPANLRELSKKYRREFLQCLFTVSAQTIKRFARDPRWLGGSVGFLSFLHTWGDSLIWHPHIHMLIPGIGLDGEGTVKHLSNEKYLFRVQSLSEVFKAAFLKQLGQYIPQKEIPFSPAKCKWVTYCEAIEKGKAQHVINYLGSYFNRTAISESRIHSYDSESVSFWYRKERKGPRSKEKSLMTLSINEFIRRFLQHVPWSGMHRVRHYGLLHPAHRKTIAQLQLKLTPEASPLLDLLVEVSVLLAQVQKNEILCPCCKSKMKLVMSYLHDCSKDPPHSTRTR